MPQQLTAPRLPESPSAEPTDTAESLANETQLQPAIPSLTHYCHPRPYPMFSYLRHRREALLSILHQAEVYEEIESCLGSPQCSDWIGLKLRQSCNPPPAACFGFTITLSREIICTGSIRLQKSGIPWD